MNVSDALPAMDLKTWLKLAVNLAHDCKRLGEKQACFLLGKGLILLKILDLMVFVFLTLVLGGILDF